MKHASAARKLQQTAAAAAAAAKDGGSNAKAVQNKRIDGKRGAANQSDSLVLDNDAMDISPQDKVKQISCSVWCLSSFFLLLKSCVIFCCSSVKGNY